MSKKSKEPGFPGKPLKAKEARINLRFSSRNFLDDLRVFAHSQGLSLPTWAKAALFREMAGSEQQDIFAERSIESLLTMQALIEKDHSPAEIKDAQDRARKYINQVQNRDG